MTYSRPARRRRVNQPITRPGQSVQEPLGFEVERPRRGRLPGVRFQVVAEIDGKEQIVATGDSLAEAYRLLKEHPGGDIRTVPSWVADEGSTGTGVA